MEVRTRMAPSPTGEYHVGHIRTLMYNYAFARKNNGKFILRIEDTDRERYVPGAVERIQDVIKMMGFEWDEGPGVGGEYGPYVQSERLDIYKKYAEELIAKGYAYYCFCTEERLEKLREKQKEHGVSKYDRHCLKLKKDEIEKNLKANVPRVIRMKVPDHEDVSFDDLILRRITINSDAVDDQVLIKADGYPTYHMAVVVDDHLMKITHVMRGNDWVPSTPKHILLYKFFGWEPPKYAHLPNLKEVGGTKKLSKRFGSVSVYEFLSEGYLPEALNNFLMFLGWNPGTDKEIYTLEEFIRDFSIERIQPTDLVAFDRQKLLWMNGLYIRNTANADLWKKLNAWSEKFDFYLHGKNAEKEKVFAVLDLIKDRMKLLSEYNSLAHYFFEDPEIEKDGLYSYVSDEERGREILEGFKNIYSGVKDWSTPVIDKISHDFISKRNYKPKEAFMTLRIAMTGETATPQIFDILGILGRETVLKRLGSALNV
ncbi:MAG: glutamate--tRNA ligase [Patescibacteria group bacterium]|nr:MAG: glutamate--tRNA ligase [Patescibacteria group bacterium]